MKKTAVLMMVLMMTVLASAAVAGDKGEGMVGSLFLFQKCVDPIQQDVPEGYDPATGCPTAEGPWPIIPDNRRWGQMKYNLLGPEFRFSFQGKNLLQDTDYTLIYYPDPWPGENLICLGSGVSNGGGNLQIHGKTPILVGDVPSGLPTLNDSNFLPKEGGSVVGAKIWLVQTSDVTCESPTGMIAWNPASYLFEGNPIIYQYDAGLPDDVEDADEDDDAPEFEEPEDGDDEEVAAPEQNKGNNGKALGKDKKK